MAALSKAIKVFIVRELAVFNTPSEVAKSVKVEFGIEVTRQRCETYDPTKRACKKLAQDLRNEFDETRKAFLDAPKNIPISNLSYRQARRQRVLDAAQSPMLILDVLDRAAKDAGGAYTNRQEITGGDGKPLLEQPVMLTPDQIKNMSAQDLAKAYFATGGK